MEKRSSSSVRLHCNEWSPQWCHQQVCSGWLILNQGLPRFQEVSLKHCNSLSRGGDNFYPNDLRGRWRRLGSSSSQGLERARQTQSFGIWRASFNNNEPPSPVLGTYFTQRECSGHTKKNTRSWHVEDEATFDGTNPLINTISKPNLWNTCLYF